MVALLMWHRVPYALMLPLNHEISHHGPGRAKKTDTNKSDDNRVKEPFCNILKPAWKFLCSGVPHRTPPKIRNLSIATATDSVLVKTKLKITKFRVKTIEKAVHTCF